jgi:hypothetical protein
LKKLIFNDDNIETPLIEIETDKQKGIKIGNFKFIASKDFKKFNRFRNIILEESRLKGIVFNSQKKKKII